MDSVILSLVSFKVIFPPSAKPITCHLCNCLCPISIFYPFIGDNEAVRYCKKPADLRPQEPRYAYTLAFYQLQKGDKKDAVKTLKALIGKQPAYADAYLLLGGTYEKQGKKEEAEEIYKKALEIDGIPDRIKIRIAAQLEALKQGKK